MRLPICIGEAHGFRQKETHLLTFSKKPQQNKKEEWDMVDDASAASSDSQITPRTPS